MTVTALAAPPAYADDLITVVGDVLAGKGTCDVRNGHVSLTDLRENYRVLADVTNRAVVYEWNVTALGTTSTSCVADNCVSVTIDDVGGPVLAGWYRAKAVETCSGSRHATTTTNSMEVPYVSGDGARLFSTVTVTAIGKYRDANSQAYVPYDCVRDTYVVVGTPASPLFPIDRERVDC